MSNTSQHRLLTWHWSSFQMAVLKSILGFQSCCCHISASYYWQNFCFRIFAWEFSSGLKYFFRASMLLLFLISGEPRKVPLLASLADNLLWLFSIMSHTQIVNHSYLFLVPLITLSLFSHLSSTTQSFALLPSMYCVLCMYLLCS